MLKAKLVVVGGDARAAEVSLKLPTVIGRGKEANLTVPHALVSRQHAKIFEKEGKLVVRDLGSLNGTFVNNTKIDKEQTLEPDQLLTLGNVTFRAVYEESHAASETLKFGSSDTLEEVNVNEKDRLSPSDSSLRFAAMNQGFLSDLIEDAPEGNEHQIEPVPPPNFPTTSRDEIHVNLADEPKPQVSHSVLQHLPHDSKVDFIDSKDLGGISGAPVKQQAGSIHIDLGACQPQTSQDVDQERLGAFAKKLSENK